jgi:eukaryotic-like serine/threonine-protein kinase
MSTDVTEPQGGAERRRAREMSLSSGHPPAQVPGYDLERCLGTGAYGEVWVALERNTGRQVAIKFYAHRGGLDWSLLSREVEKLAFLFADRYVVQLLGVGWDAEPPYYVMEYLERGSLAERIQHGPLRVDEALAIFRDVATGLVHAHGKGVLHCDLKPANILLDQDYKPRLADFGQSRLSTEQVPALGTMFYMAPEQADLEAVPEVRWDVYALGALLYCMLTGGPPHRTAPVAEEFERTPDLAVRLSRYRQMIENSPSPSAHRRVRGMDRALAEIIDRCLAADPEKRFPNVQAVLEALDLRSARRARQPLMVLGAIGPAMLLLVVTWFAWQGFNSAVRESNAALTRRALDSNRFAAQNVALAAGTELEQRFDAVEEVAAAPRFRRMAALILDRTDLQGLAARLSNPAISKEEQERLRAEFEKDLDRTALEKEFAATVDSVKKPKEEEGLASWFFCDPHGISTARLSVGSAAGKNTTGKNYAWRSFFHGGAADREPSWRPQPGQRLEKPQISAIFRSQSTSRWIVAIAAPVFDDSPQKKFLGVVGRTTEVGRFIKFPGSRQQFAVLVDYRDGQNKGLIVEHPLFHALLDQGELPERLKDCRLGDGDLPNATERQERYADPLAGDEEGGDYDQRWLAAMEPVRVRGSDAGWLVIVQEAYDAAIGSTLAQLKADLVRYGLIALAWVALLLAALWGFAARLARIGLGS